MDWNSWQMKILGLYLFDLSNLSANEWLELNFNQYSLSLSLFPLMDILIILFMFAPQVIYKTSYVKEM